MKGVETYVECAQTYACACTQTYTNWLSARTYAPISAAKFQEPKLNDFKGLQTGFAKCSAYVFSST